MQHSDFLTRGVEEVIIKKDLEKKLRSGKKLRIKFGIDPTGSLLHLGHAVVLMKLKEFQDKGHTIIFLIGDFTARIGDPSGRNKLRSPLSEEEIKENMKSYLTQASTIIDTKKVELRYNSEWYEKMDIRELIKISSLTSVTQILHRAEFKERVKKGGEISMPEILYPLLQGYDSVVLKSDVEVGGTDQRFNLFMGRQLQERYNQPPQDVLMVPILEGLDGKEKMSKTYDNYIGLTEAPTEMYGKVMSVPDTLMWKYFTYLTRIPLKRIETLSRQIKAGTAHPRDVKMALAREIVSFFYNTKDAQEAELAFIQVFQEKKAPDEMPVIFVEKKNLSLLDLLMVAKLVASKSEARRIISQGGISIDGVVYRDSAQILPLSHQGIIIKRGKRHFVKIMAQ
ncbi:tyrosine--tRNA ligase [Candidatus Uhrbacteria bacterium]|nr:tyrosine--tRNA ligase [Candidatus Uhrbacteria bacterium]